MAPPRSSRSASARAPTRNHSPGRRPGQCTAHPPRHRRQAQGREQHQEAATARRPRAAPPTCPHRVRGARPGSRTRTAARGTGGSPAVWPAPAPAGRRVERLRDDRDRRHHRHRETTRGEQRQPGAWSPVVRGRLRELRHIRRPRPPSRGSRPGRRGPVRCPAPPTTSRCHPGTRRWQQSGGALSPRGERLELCPGRVHAAAGQQRRHEPRQVHQSGRRGPPGPGAPAAHDDDAQRSQRSGQAGRWGPQGRERQPPGRPAARGVRRRGPVLRPGPPRAARRTPRRRPTGR